MGEACVHYTHKGFDPEAPHPFSIFQIAALILSGGDREEDKMSTL
jgi:hypothetical protein